MSRSHARFSPSKLGAKEKCSKFDYEQTPTGTVNESADEGELMHKAYETGDLSILQTEEQRAQVEKVIQYTDTLTAGLDASRFTSLSEIKLEIPDYTFGYADRIIIIYDENKNIKEAHILDAKFGRKGADDADSNAQIMCYAGGLLFGNVYFNEVDTDSQLNVPLVHGHIVAPRLDSITTVTYTQDDKPRILGRLEAILQKANDPFDPPTPNSDLCPNCQWRATCPAVNQLAARTSQALDQFIPSIVDPSRLSSASPEDKSRAYALAQILESWSEAAKKTITQSIITTGQDLPNYQKVKRAGSIKIANTQEAMAMMQGVIPEAVVMQSATLSLSKLADAYAEHTGETKRESRDRIEEILGPVLERAPDITFFQRKRGVSERDILSSVPQIQISNNTPQPE